MQLRWTEEAADDLQHTAGYLLTHAHSRAQDLLRAVYLVRKPSHDYDIQAPGVYGHDSQPEHQRPGRRTAR